MRNCIRCCGFIAVAAVNSPSRSGGHWQSISAPRTIGLQVRERGVGGKFVFLIDSKGSPPDEVADALRKISTKDGEALLFNLHVTTAGGLQIVFPTAETELSDEYSRMLFRMSSPLPETMLAFARQQMLPVGPGARGFGYNTDLSNVVQFLDIGTQTQPPTKPG